MLYEEFLRVVDDKQDALCEISDYLYDNPETCFTEEKAVKKIAGFLEKEGFNVELGVANIPTAVYGYFW